MILLIAVCAFLLVECLLRLIGGLGDPPLLVADDSIGYLNRQGAYNRFGNEIRYNANGLRADATFRKKANEFRALVCGDSIVHGTARVSQAELATEIAQDRLATSLGRPVTVLNVAACGWAPRNLLAYLKKYGTFDADMAILVFNGDDLLEPSAPGGDVYPTVAPALAIQEAFQLAARRWFSCGGGPLSADCVSSRPTIETLVEMLQGQGTEVLIVYHPTAAEAQMAEDSPSYQALANCAAAHSVPCLSLQHDLLQDMKDNESPWRPDGLHLTVRGQAVLAKVLAREVSLRVGREGRG